MEFYENLLNHVSQSPSDYYNDEIQNAVNELWDDTNRLYTIKEQKGLPFEHAFNEYEAWLDTVADDSVNLNKNVPDFISILYKDRNHPINYKGQYYEINLDGKHEETYICYDKINPLSQLPKFKVVRCNQMLTWIDHTNGDIKQMPCYIGYDISSTNNQYSKDGVIPNVRMVIYTQANDYTLTIKTNQRFMFSHKQCYKVEQVEDYEYEQLSNKTITFVKLYIAYSPLLPTDNKELNICDYYDYQYSLTIDDSSDIIGTKGTQKQLHATVYLKKNVQDINVEWKSLDESVATVSNDGLVTFVGEPNTSTQIVANIEGNDEVTDTVNVSIIEEQKEDNTDNGDNPTPHVPVVTLIVSPSQNIKLLEEDEQEYTCSLYKDNQLVSDGLKNIDCTPNWTGDNYTLTKTDKGYKVINNRQSKQELILTFSYNGTEFTDVQSVSVSIKLGGML